MRWPWILVGAITGLIVGGAAVWAASTSSVRSRISRLDNRVALLQAEQEARQKQLLVIRSDIEQAKADLELARIDAQRAQCEAMVARIDARIIHEQARCYEQISRHAECTAKVEKKKADRSLWGALAGAGLVLVTGGAGAALLAGGAVGGGLARAGSTEACGDPPACVIDREEVEISVLTQQGLARRPSCAISGPAAR